MKTRFAPSPTGPLHLGHVYAAFYAHDLAVAKRGEFHLRIEDIDQSRAKPHWEAQIFEDLNWLGLSWSLPVLRQSERSNAYDHALDQLWDHGLLYPCSCQRKDIHAAASAPQEGTPIYGPDGLLYPGTCRTLARPAKRPKAANVALRLDMAAALKHLNLQALTFDECGTGAPFHGPYTVLAADMCASIGDVVLQRRDMGTSYHLSVVVDDAFEGITDVTRGADLFEATPIHILLQKLLNLPVPRYHHHELIRDDSGKRLAKRDDARAISKYRDDGRSPAEVKALIGL